MTNNTHKLSRYESKVLEHSLNKQEGTTPFRITEEGEFGENVFNRDIYFSLPGVVTATGTSSFHQEALKGLSLVLKFNEPLTKPSRSMPIGKFPYKLYGFDSDREIDISALYIFTLNQLIRPYVYSPFRGGPHSNNNLFEFSRQCLSSEHKIAKPLSTTIKRINQMTPREIFLLTTNFLPTDQDTYLWENSAYMEYPGENGFRLNSWSCQFNPPPESTEGLPFVFLPNSGSRRSKKSEIPSEQEFRAKQVELRRRNAMINPLPGSFESTSK